MTFSTMFFKLKDGSIKSLKHKEGLKINLDDSELYYDQSFDFSEFPLKTVQAYLNNFCDYQIIQSDSSTLCLIAHLNFVSVFDILAWKWVNHIEFSHEVKCLFY